MEYGRWLLVLLLGWSLSGCAAFVAHEIETPGHSGGTFRPLDHMLEQIGFARHALKISDGVRIAYWIAPPRAYQIKDRVQTQVGKQSTGAVSVDMSLGNGPLQPALLPVKGSVVLLHPWSLSGTAMFMWGIHFAAAGYVVVMPDLRSQGDSSDAPVGYGPREAGDIVALVHHLQTQQRLPAPLYLLGASYGATVALFAAPQLPDLRGVVALEPYADAAAVIRRAPDSGLFGYNWLAHWITPKDVDVAIARASKKLSVDLEHTNPGDALARSPTCTLLLRGSRDMLISDTALAALSRRSSRATYVEIFGEGHETLLLRTDRMLPPLLAWMQALPAAGGPCPVFALPSAGPAASIGTATTVTAKAQSR